MPLNGPHLVQESNKKEASVKHQQEVTAAQADKPSAAQLFKENEAQRRAEKIARILEEQTPASKGVRFNVSLNSEHTQVQIVDQETNEILRSFPSEEMIKVMDRIEDFLGITLDMQA